MSTRTIIEINHDHLNARQMEELADLFNTLGSSTVTGLLNRNDGKAFSWSTGILVLAQRHHSETLKLTVE